MKPLKELVHFERYDADRVRTEENIQEYIREHIRLKMKFKELARKSNFGDVTIGSACYPDDGKTPRALIEHAVSQIPHF